MIVECPGCKHRYDVSGRPAGTQTRCSCGTTFTLPEPPRNAAALQCPTCGAAVKPTSSICEYCNTQLAVKACPRCFGMILMGSNFCRHCGAQVNAPAKASPDGQSIPRLCPRCRSSQKIQLEGPLVCEVLLDSCPACHGVFLDNALLERLLAEKRYAPRQLQAEETVEKIIQARTTACDSGPVYIRCPDCDRFMIRRNFWKRSGVIVDICQDHGTWLDANELERLIDFVQRDGSQKLLHQELEQVRPHAPLQNTSLHQKSNMTDFNPPSRRASATPDAESNLLEKAIGALSRVLFS